MEVLSSVYESSPHAWSGISTSAVVHVETVAPVARSVSNKMHSVLTARP